MTQDATWIVVRVSEMEFYMDGTHFTFFCKPFLLKVCFVACFASKAGLHRTKGVVCLLAAQEHGTIVTSCIRVRSCSSLREGPDRKNCVSPQVYSNCAKYSLFAAATLLQPLLPTSAARAAAFRLKTCCSSSTTVRVGVELLTVVHISLPWDRDRVRARELSACRASTRLLVNGLRCCYRDGLVPALLAVCLELS